MAYYVSATYVALWLSGYKIRFGGVQAELFQEAIRPLHEAVNSLHGWMVAIGGFLERAQTMLVRFSQTPANPLVLLFAGKVGASGAGLHGSFSS
jgi:hypothetical protein